MRFLVALGLATIALAALASTAQAQPVTPRMYAVKLAVRDVARTTEFYAQLGMEAGPQHNEWEAELRWDKPERGSSIIMVDEDMSERFHVQRGGSTLIISVPDVYAALDRLEAAGFAVAGAPHVTEHSAIIMIQDPDGNWIELAGPPLGPNQTANDSEG